MTLFNMNGVALKTNYAAGDFATIRSDLQTGNTRIRDAIKELSLAKKAGGDLVSITTSIMADKQMLRAFAVATNCRLKPSSRRTLDNCLEVANTLNPLYPIAEEVRVTGQKKKNGDLRPICNFGLRHRTSQAAVERIVSALFTPRDFQFTFKGVASAIKRAEKLYKDGYIYAAKMDIKNFYQSFQCEQLVGVLPFPKGVGEYVVHGQHMQVTLGANRHGLVPSLTPYTNLIPQARLGIPQGSVCSPIVAAYCLSSISWVAPKDVVIINFADDFLVLAKSENSLQYGMESLAQAALGIPGGQFDLKTKWLGNLNDGPGDFLGHRLRGAQKKLFVSLTNMNMDVMLRTLNEIELKLTTAAYYSAHKDMKAAKRHCAEFLMFIKGWMAAFYLCDDALIFFKVAKSELEHHMKNLGFTFGQLSENVHPYMDYQPSYCLE